jgi:adenine-specific DNA-methyltransferase
MRDITTIENRRRAEQSRLDTLKDAKERNRLGQFSTPLSLSLEIARYARSLWNARGPVCFLDPAIGSGSFYSALLQAFPVKAISDACGIEVDPLFAGTAGSLWTPTGLRVVRGDFTKLAPERRFNLILTNPPYVRHHHIAAADKPRLQALSHQIAGVRPSGLSGLYCYFLFLTHAWMSEDALAVWLIPSEFMDVNYGSAVKRYLTSRVTLLRVHRFDPKVVQFGDALVTSAVVAFVNRPPRSDDAATFTYGGTLAAPSASESIPIVELHRVSKWTSLPHSRQAAGEQTIRLADLFTIKRGLATGSNSFFILPREQALQKGIPPEALKPILPSPRHLRTSIVEADADGWPALPEPLALIDCSVPDDELKHIHPAFWAYLDSGREKGVDRGYLASRRVPWYSQEQRPPAPFLCTYMGRQRDTAKPFRFIWNKSQATAANVYLLLYPRPNLARISTDRPQVAEAVFGALNGLDIEHMISNGRVYGGGLHKLEPSELGNLSAASIAGAAGIHIEAYHAAASSAQLEFAF